MNMSGTTQLVAPRREAPDKTSMSIDHDLWKEVRHTAIELDMSATSFVEEACKEKILKLRHGKQ
jgi:hypothetical protein